MCERHLCVRHVYVWEGFVYERLKDFMHDWFIWSSEVSLLQLLIGDIPILMFLARR